MKKVIVSLIALAAFSGGAFADDSSNGQSSRELGASVINSAPSAAIVDRAAVVYTTGSSKSDRNEAGNGYASHNLY